MLHNLHLLRAVAALAVVYFHTTSEAGLNLSGIGSHGVDVFFVISGFIIPYVEAQSAGAFLIRRIIRIVPFYWAATLALFAAALIVPHILHSTGADFTQLLCSLFFIPFESSDGGVLPTLILGWSLNYEMYFYVMFALALAVAPKRAPLACSVGVLTILAVVDLSGSTHPSATFYGRPLVVEFLYGVCAYYLFRLAERRAGWFARRPRLRKWLWFVVLNATLTLGIEESHGGFGWPRFVAAGLPAFALVLAAVLLERLYGVSARFRPVLLMGESSYILYLIHPYVIYGVLRTMRWESANLSWPATIVLIVGLLLLSALAAIAIHVWFEKPVITALRQRVHPRSDPIAPRHSRPTVYLAFRLANRDTQP